METAIVMMHGESRLTWLPVAGSLMAFLLGSRGPASRQVANTLLAISVQQILHEREVTELFFC